MQKFTDAAGNCWQINITTRDIVRVRQATGVDLGGLFDDGLKPFADLCSDVVRLIDVIWSAIGSDNELDRTRFDNAMTGDAIESGTKALLDAVIDFFPNPQRRQAIRTTLRKSWEAVDQQTTKALAEIEAIDPTSLLSATNAGALSGSIRQD